MSKRTPTQRSQDELSKAYSAHLDRELAKLRSRLRAEKKGKAR
jgi:hypothetical protein